VLVVRREAPVGELVVTPPDFPAPTMVVARPSDGAVVLGSTQPEADFDAAAVAATGRSLVRRRSGGGAVFVGPGRQLWVDFFVPAADPLFDRDVGRAAAPLGEAWRAALADCGLDPALLAVHRGGLVAAPYSRQLCFLGLGPGEVTFGRRKVVGLSQRRNRAGAWFFTMAPLVSAPTEEAALLALDPDERTRAAAALASGVVAPALDPEALEAALRRHLERLGGR